MPRTSTFFAEAARINRPVLLPARMSSLLALRRQRAHLAMLDERALADIGLTRHEAETEANRPIWDVPPHWRK